MTHTAEYKGWHAHALAALEFYRDHGGDAMVDDDRIVYEHLLTGVQDAADRHNAAIDLR